MATATHPSSVSDTAILSRLIRPEVDDLSADAAESLLRIRFDQGDLERLHDLVARNQDDLLAPGEKADMDNYRRVNFLLDLMHSKARTSLKKHRAVR
jgi:hypothetical protein